MKRGFVTALPEEPWMALEDVSDRPMSEAQERAMARPGVDEAERLARELCARVAPPMTSERIVWWAGPEWRASHLPAWSALDRIRMVLFPRDRDSAAAIAAREADRRFLGATGRRDRAATYYLGPLHGLDAAWRVAGAEGLELDGVRIADRANPFTPLLDLVQLGFALHAAERAHLVLVCSDEGGD